MLQFRSKLYLNGALLVVNDGLHGIVEKCSESQLDSGPHTVYVAGFQSAGGVGMEVKYMGPDTAEGGTATKIFMRSGVLPPSISLASKLQRGTELSEIKRGKKYLKSLTKTAGTELYELSFKVCVFLQL